MALFGCRPLCVDCPRNSCCDDVPDPVAMSVQPELVDIRSLTKAILPPKRDGLESVSVLTVLNERTPLSVSLRSCGRRAAGDAEAHGSAATQFDANNAEVHWCAEAQHVSCECGTPYFGQSRDGEAHWSTEAQRVSYEDGSTYFGQIRDRKRHGHGIWKRSGTQYEGQWINDQQHGHGFQTWSDGRLYDGQFEWSKFSGKGRMVWNSAEGRHAYEGSYKDDLKHGAGKFVWADGRIYDGQWVNGQRHGKGMYIDTKGRKRIGAWLCDKFERYGPDQQTEMLPGSFATPCEELHAASTKRMVDATWASPNPLQKAAWCSRKSL